MTDDDESWHVGVKMPPEWRDIAKKRLDHGEQSRILREALRQRLFGEGTTMKERLKHQIEETEEDLKTKRRRRDQLNEEIERLADHKRGLEERIQQIEKEQEEYTERIDRMAEEWDRIAYDHSEIVLVAETYGRDTRDVQEGLRERGVDVLSEDELGL